MNLIPELRGSDTPSLPVRAARQRIEESGIGCDDNFPLILASVENGR